MTTTPLLPPGQTGLPTPTHTPRRRRKTWVLTTVLAAAVAIGVLPNYLGLQSTSARVDVSNAAPWHYAVLLLHIAGSVIALAVGPWQFATAVRRRPRLHRVLGRVYLFGGVLPGSLAGIVVAVLSTAGPTAWVGFSLLDVLWFTTAFLGWRAARTHRYGDHAAWMTRNYALTFAGVTLRLWFVILILALQPLLNGYFHGDGDALVAAAYLVTPWLSWVPNLIVGEALVARLRSSRQPARVPATAASLR